MRLKLAVGGIVLSAASAWATGDLAGLSVAELMALRPPSQSVAAAGRFYNVEGVIPPQCYTKIEGVHNPCYVCHQSYDDADRPNTMRDGSLQEAYSFSDAALTNHWSNLFVDRSDAVAAISDDEILAYIAEDNYSGLRPRLQAMGWDGYLPDMADYQRRAEAFDDRGLARDGSGWVAFTYKPQPSTFRPTNGSTDDVLIRLPEQFRTTADGAPSNDAYMANLALLEIAFQDFDATTPPPVDEAAIGVDLDGDGRLAMTTRVLRRDTYVGAAADHALDRMRHPEGTEFLHSVRYVGVADGGIVIPPRMKELRYMRKTVDMTPAMLRTQYDNERQERIDENLPPMSTSAMPARTTASAGRSSASSRMTTAGCGRRPTRSSSFAAAATAPSAPASTRPGPSRASSPGPTAGAMSTIAPCPMHRSAAIPSASPCAIFERAGGGDAFRSNAEMLARCFDADGNVDAGRMQVAASVYDLIAPSPERALILDKAYRVLVAEQSFRFGRDATVTPPANVHHVIDAAMAPTLQPEFRYAHDIRLDWGVEETAPGPGAAV